MRTRRHWVMTIDPQAACQPGAQDERSAGKRAALEIGVARR